MVKLPSPIYATNVDGTFNSDSITHRAKLVSSYLGHTSTEWYYVANIGAKDMVIGMTWLRSHNPQIDWRTGRISFTRCPLTCLRHDAQDKIHKLFDTSSTSTQYPTSETLGPPSQYLDDHDINNISTQLAIEELKKTKVLTIDDIRKGPFAEYVDVFEEASFQKLPPHRPWDHKIDLVDGWESLVWTPKVYPLTYDEQKELDKFLDENLANGRIRPSESPLASPVFFIDKKDGNKRMVIDYRGLNKLTVKNAYPLPLTDELLQKWEGGVWFTALDVRSGYHNIRMREGDEWKTAFITKRGLYESLVMTFGLCNAPATFQTMMDNIFVVYTRRGDAGCYIDDVDIVTKLDPTGKLSSEEFHIKVVKQILQVFRENHLYLKPEKCIFMKKEIPYLGHIISGQGIRPDPVKLEGVTKWPPPTNLKELRSFLGFINYYRRFVRDFSKIARTLHDLTKKDVPWEWKDEHQQTFELLKKTLVSPPTLSYPSHDLPYLLETDASLYACGAVLSQLHKDGLYRPVGYMSTSLSPAERNYDTHDRELLAIIKALEQWRHFLQGTRYPVIVLTDHANLQAFREAKDLNRRQARWMRYLVNFDLEITYRPGRESSVPDLLSRRIDHKTEDIKDDNKGEVLLPDRFFKEKHRINAISLSERHAPNLLRDIYLAQAADPLVLKFNMTKESETVPVGWSKHEDIWCYRGKIYLPAPLRQTVFRILHDDPSAAHPGRDAVMYSIRQNYYWPSLATDVPEWVQNCDKCQHIKIYPRKPHGTLKPIDPTPRPWGVVTSDLITGLPTCQGYDAIWTATCKATKAKHIAPTTSTLDSRGLYQLYLENVWKLHGTSDKLITDRGPQYASHFAKEANKNLQIETALSTAYHPQTDGQSERTNQEVEQALRSVVNFHQDDWVDWMPVVEFALNNRFVKSLGTTPFYANYGFHPRIGSLPQIETPVSSVEDFVKHIQQVQKDTKVSLQQAAEDMKRFYDRHRGKTPEFEVGQQVLLDNSDLAIDRPTRKLAERRSGPFKVLAKVGTHAYRLELPPTWKSVHPVFHVSKINPYHEDPQNPNFTNPPPDIIEGEPEWEVEAVLASRFIRNRLQYLVKWKNWPDSENSWENEDNLENSPELVVGFHKSHPGAPRRLSDGTRTGLPLKTSSRKKKRTRIHGMDFVPLSASTDISTWPPHFERLHFPQL